MNAYTLPLNEPEKRHSTFQGDFKWFINHLSDEFNEFFVQFGVFTDRQIVRMADADLLSDSVLAMERGVVSTSPSDLRALYKRYDEGFPGSEECAQRLHDAVEYIGTELEPLRNTYMMKPYALHSLLTGLIHCKFGIAQITEAWNVPSVGEFSLDTPAAREGLLALAQAHETKEVDGPFGTYVWGCAGGTNRAPRRTARVAAVMRALGADVPEYVDGQLT
jgi:hypothetical protein